MPKAKESVNYTNDDKEDWLFNKYKDEPFFYDYEDIRSKLKKGEFDNLTNAQYKKKVHIDFPNVKKMTEFFEDLHYADPKNYELVHKRSTSKKMLNNKKAEKRFKDDMAKNKKEDTVEPMPRAKKSVEKAVEKGVKVALDELKDEPMPEKPKAKKPMGSASNLVMNTRKKKAEAGGSVQSMMDSSRIGATMASTEPVNPIVADAVKKTRKALKSPIVPITEATEPEPAPEAKKRGRRPKAAPAAEPMAVPKKKTISREQKAEKKRADAAKEREGMAYKEIESAEDKIKNMFSKELSNLGHARSKVNFKKLEHEIAKAIRCVARATGEDPKIAEKHSSKPKRSATTWAEFVKEKGGVKAASAAKEEYERRKQYKENI
jgi:hypothetical protein